MSMRQPNYIDMTGQKIGMLTALHYTRANNGAMWLFHCDCGKSVELKASFVRTKRQHSCGCLSRQMRFQGKNLLEPGKMVGDITPLRTIGKRGHNIVWECQCFCRQVFTVLASNLTSGNTQSCGCHKRRVLREKARTHGMTSTPIYGLWQNMMRRCYDPKNRAFPNYGGRGIVVCPRWHAVDNFFADMGDRPQGRSVERLNNDGPYSPENCVWATAKEQGRNTRKNVCLTINGETKTLAEWAEISHIPYARLRARKTAGWPPEHLLDPKVQPIGRRLVATYAKKAQDS